MLVRQGQRLGTRNHIGARAADIVDRREPHRHGLDALQAPDPSCQGGVYGHGLHINASSGCKSLLDPILQAPLEALLTKHESEGANEAAVQRGGDKILLVSWHSRPQGLGVDVHARPPQKARRSVVDLVVHRDPVVCVHQEHSPPRSWISASREVRVYRSLAAALLYPLGVCEVKHADHLSAAADLGLALLPVKNEHGPFQLGFGTLIHHRRYHLAFGRHGC
mmetsp:Transcript_35245/g.99747  ORF Transcript_35245/g.99747 Transcript_35245/m.99747 type:complete len:222 (+) Transcript_35245:2374-3039(+)